MQSLLLDTCVFLWLAHDPVRIPEATLETVGRPEREIFVSVCSLWEMGIKDGKGLSFHKPFEDFVESVLAQYAIELMPIQVAACARLSKLPPIHKDPFDRMLIAQAIVSGTRIVTPDKTIARYPISVLWG